MISREVKTAAKEMDMNELSTMTEELLDDILRKSFHNVQGDIQSVIYSVNEQEMLDLLRKDKVGETLDAHIPKIFDTNAATERLSKSLLTLS